MANRILTEEGWEQRILDKLGLDVAYLPITAIQQPECILVAEANIIKQIPRYEEAIDDALTYLEASVVCECSALICPSMSTRLPKKEAGPHENHELDVDWTKRKFELEQERDGYIGKVFEISFPELIPSFMPTFGVTNPIRGW